MPTIQYEGQSYMLLEKESVLDALLRNGIHPTHSCKAGACGSCLMRAASGPVPARAQLGVKDSLRVQGYFLACVCHPEADLELAARGAEAELGATICGMELLSADVMRVRLCCDAPIDFRSGQFVSIVRGDGLARSYSVASLPHEGELELHVRKIVGGRMSGWLHDEAQIGDRVRIVGPSGDCFYVPGSEEQPLLLVGTGTGLAPLYGILRDALRHGHRGPIHLFHGALHAGALYLVEELRKLGKDYSQFEYTPAVLRGEALDGVVIGAIDQVVLQRLPNLGGWRGYICGDPGVVQILKKKLFLAGMASREIFADPFIPAA